MAAWAGGAATRTRVAPDAMAMSERTIMTLTPASRQFWRPAAVGAVRPAPPLPSGPRRPQFCRPEVQPLPPAFRPPSSVQSSGCAGRRRPTEGAIHSATFSGRRTPAGRVAAGASGHVSMGSCPMGRSVAGCSTRARMRLAMKRAVRTGVPPAGHLGDLDDAPPGVDLDPAPVPGRHDLVGADLAAGVDDDLHPVTAHILTVARGDPSRTVLAPRARSPRTTRRRSARGGRCSRARHRSSGS